MPILPQGADSELNEVVLGRNRAERCPRDTCPAALHYLSMTGVDFWGLQGTHGDNELDRNPLPPPSHALRDSFRASSAIDSAAAISVTELPPPALGNNATMLNQVIPCGVEKRARLLARDQ